MSSLSTFHPLSMETAASAAAAATTAAGHATRPLVMTQHTTKVAIPVPLPLWPIAENLKETFPTRDAPETTELELLSDILEFALGKASNQDTFEALPLVAVIFRHLQARLLKQNDIHAVTRDLAPETRAAILKTYYLALVALKRHGLVSSAEIKPPASALFAAAEAGRANLLAVFGGQGNVEEYFSELVSLYTTYEAFARPFIYQAALTLANISNSPEAQAEHSAKMDVISWLEKPETRPSTESLLATHQSLPLIGLTQLTNYYITFKVLDKTPGELRSLLAGTTGHSQGIVSSVVVSSSETEKEFVENTQKALVLLYWLGLRSQRACPATTLDPNILQDSLANNEGVPTPMLAVTGLRNSDVQQHADTTNSFLPPDRRVHLSLINGPRSTIFTGPPQSLYGLNVSLRKLKAQTGQDQSRIPFSQRKVRFSSRFLPVAVPFHSEYLKHVPNALQSDIELHNLAFDAKKMRIPVYHTHTGEDLRNTTDLTMSLVNQICVQPVHWEKATNTQSISHVLDFGPGGASGVGFLTHRNKEGTGVQVVLAGSLESGMSELLDRSYLFDEDVHAVKFAPNWAEKYRPKLIRIASTGEIHVDTPFSRLLGKAPLMVAGMTPCTSNEHFVAACINAGFHVELAGGGQHTEPYLRDRVQKIMEKIEPGEGITLNILFLNPRLWGFQYPAVQAMRREGIPMEGVCVAAGVPSLDVADQIIKNLKAAGLRHVAFKPGSVETIRRVISIARTNPDMPIILQWTGGRGGGHHSFEDFHQPMLETYGAIRREPNLILVVGSGFGDAVETLPYLTGEWSQKFDHPPMPFDGLLFGSRVMVAKEALTSPAVKELIVKAPGIQDETLWERTYKGDIGGILTVKSELGEPIHKIANRGVKFWKEMDDTFFSLSREKRLPALLKKKDYIIERLNADFQKPWFGQSDGRPCDLHEMTYTQVIRRLFELLWVPSRWIDSTLRDTFGDFLRRVEERFVKGETLSMLQSYSTLDHDPASFIEAFLETFPEASHQTLTQEDVFYFLTICSYPFRKPVPFIPIIDEKFEFWFKKDSLWQAEDVDAVVGRDAGRVAILQGPVAVRHCTKVDQPVKEILGDIYAAHIDALRKLYYGDSNVAIPVVEYLGARPAPPTHTLDGIRVTELNEGSIMYEITRNAQAMPSTPDFMQFISGPDHTWLRALLTSEAIVQGKHLVPNPVTKILRARPAQTLFVKYDARRQPVLLTLHDRDVDRITPDRHPAVVITAEGDRIKVELFVKRDKEFVALELLFRYKPWQGHNPIHEIMEGRNQRIKDFYSKLWHVDPSDSHLTPKDTFRSVYKVQSTSVLDFAQVIGNQAELYVTGKDPNTPAPMDFAIVAGWRSLVSAILPKEIDGDLLRLVHLSNQFRMLDPHDTLRAGDEITTEAVIESVIITEAGKAVEVKATLIKNQRPLMEIVSTFLYRGTFTDYENTFRRTTEKPVQVVLSSNKDIQVLQSKTWIKWNTDAPQLTPGAILIFRLETFAQNADATVYAHVQTTGSVFLKTTRETIQVGRVDYHATHVHGNIVLDYLTRHGSSIEQPVFFKSGGYSILPDPKVFPATVTVPLSNGAYAVASGDLNPIHTNPYFADLANLPGTITHGMWTSASTRKFVEIFAANNRPERVKEYNVVFLNMVLPGDQLETKLYHVGMSNGKKLIKVITLNSKGVKVLEGSAEVEQPATSYVFTGQGSQEVGMGMDLYETSAIAREIWDRADAHMLQTYGVSILSIVRTNPTSQTIHFGGQKGASIRRNFMSMTYDVVQDGLLKSLPLFPGITDQTPSYTFSHPNGLLSATQFTQPALTLMEIASFQDMRANGLVQQDCPFAGHSLGEYAGLASVGQVLSVESLVDVVFYRGMTMQVAVQRDDQGRSNYGMCAVNPIRVGSTFSEQALVFIVEAIARRSGDLLEIVNYNVENFQYVLAGELTNLETLRVVLNKVKGLNVNFIELGKTKSVEEIQGVLDGIVEDGLASARKKRAASNGILSQERGVATIPLAGIDVPFHSSFLLNGVVPFREILRKKLEAKFINVALLVGKYIPNLTAEPFSLSKDYFQTVYDLTHSSLLQQVLSDWDETLNTTAAQQQQLGYILLIELLAHQFASPVRWIETQDQLFRAFKVERLIEVGPSPVLCSMAGRTLKIKYEAYDDAVTHRRVQLCTTKDRKEIYYDFRDEVVDVVEEDKAAVEQVPVKSAAPAPVVPAPAARTAAAVTDEPITAQEILLVLIAQKLKKPLSDVPLSKCIKDLVGGKSTLQNEILGDLAAEFGNVLADKAEELPLSEVSMALQDAHGGALGKTSNGLVNKMVGSKMPGGFGMGQVKAYLTSAYGLGPKRSQGVLLHGLLSEPASRLANETDAKAWIDTVVKSYADKVGITLGGTTEGPSQTSGTVVTIDSKEFDKHKLALDLLVRQQLETFAKYLDLDLLAEARTAATERDARDALQAQLDHWIAEHGDVYAEGIKPSFDRLKARVFDSHWNWARQDALQLYYDMIFGRISSVDRELMNQCIHLMNRAEDAESLVTFMEYYLENCPEARGENFVRAKALSKILLENCREALKADPVYKNLAYRPTRPKTHIKENGELVYNEERRKASNMKDYVEEMRAGSDLTRIPDSQILVSKFEQLAALMKSAPELNGATKSQVDAIFAEIQQNLPPRSGFQGRLPFVFLKRRNPVDPSQWEPDADLSTIYLDTLAKMANEGISFKGRHALITGCGKESIGVDVLKALLSGGARVIVTTSRFSKSSTEFYRSIYERHGSKGSRLVVVPFNGASFQDTVALVEYIYDTKGGLGWDLDFIIPFAAIPEQGREIDGIDSKSELAHRIMLTNLLRLMGQVKAKKQVMKYDTRPAVVVLPLSPNHGTFGNDGLYSESKIGLETLFNRFHSESWSSYLTIVGAVIGWTRGTGLMSANNIVAEGIEWLGARTFSTHEMAFNLIGLLHPDIVKLSGVDPIWADLNGGLHFVADLNRISSQLRRDLLETSEIRRAVAREAAIDRQVMNGPVKHEQVLVTPRANMKFKFPSLDAQKLTHLRGMLDLEKVVVVTGFGEVGPFGGSRTRWELEAYGELSLEGSIEMAWMMGFIKFHTGPLKKLATYSGWIDAQTQEPVKDHEVKAKYEKKILEHSGIRLIEPALFNGYDPEKKMFLQEIAVTSDMAPIEVSKEEAEAMKRQHGAAAVVEQRGEQYFVRLQKGATLYVPKALRFDRLVAGQIPTGWDAKRYGVPDDIVSQVDPITLYTLVSTVEALVTSGVTDPYEFYQYVHVSEVGNTSGGGMGGMRAMQRIFRERFLEKPVQADILQESFINTMPAWINMLLLSSSGPIKTPVGACATAAESVEVAVDTILSGKAKVVLCGGYDDFQEEGSHEFANMRATSNSVEEFARGREPRDMCRPATDTRAGFMEAQGAGIQVLMTADLAIKMGVPIRGIIACTNTATDKNGRSVPAPGQGILTTAREAPGKHRSPLLNFEYRAKQLRREREHIKQWVAKEYEALADEVEEIKKSGEEVDQDFVNERTAFIEKEGKRRENVALSTWSHDWWKNDPAISPLRGALATFGLTIDDIGVASFHGTGTKANDYNESSALNQQLTHLGRSRGNLIPAVFQKHLTGHPKGAAAAWMLNGVLQVLETGIVPGNRNLDNVEDRLRQFKYILYPSRSIKTDGIRAGLLKSFGFGQAGGEILVIHPDYLFAALEEPEFNDYLARRQKRETASYRYFHEMLTGAAPFVRVKSAAPYTNEQQSGVYLNPLSRAAYDKSSGSWNFNAQSKALAKPDVSVTKALIEASAQLGEAANGRGLGIDVQLCSEVPADNETFLARNFTEQERAYCSNGSCPQSSFAGRWAAKEAVIKAVSSAAGTVVWTKGAGAPLNEIEVLREDGMAPVVVFHGEAKDAVEKAGVKEVKVTISHSGSYAVAMAVTQ
ncbi:phosphopantetheine-protein transferase domain [Spizellomyces punctatus DAOM BR117]|uniref:Phosphopantetheine-protein transferase domain n=1 Tax=Spizellomyces punctatus (strain DAOM BR117) TaxID=645134 RepID=A0A0L0HAM9_SPIPD|nr:phosphopantetheine-protein transferase domain [Spizellomyces punctatus DAOM BR117]KNC98227.1 phosphopantetheine-protein transferase domain [Spizellomyces punctatus DAOM BR117]|eukprot:XP_016606267.1 phosphopantetheine-protein transferase domain [Spizellomyces punctatus DAOM BR117]